MHSIVLAATGYSLLLSSFITLAFLLRKGCSKKNNKSPFCILSTSDVLSTILTAILLLVNQIEAGIKLSYNRQNDTFNDTSNRTWSFEEKENYQFPFLQLRNVPDPDVTLTCDIKGTFMQYGILLAALTNAFVSLMTLTLQCNLTATCVKRRCTDMIESIDTQPKDVKVTQREETLSEDGQETTFQDNIDKLKKNESNFWQGIMKILKFQIASKGNGPAKVFVASHWFVSFIVVAILYLAEYDDMNAIRYTEDIGCAFDSNFPMNDFYIFSDVEDLKIADSIMYTTPMGNKYLEELSSKIKPSRAEVDEIVLKVQKIVKNALNYTNDSSENTKNNFLASSLSMTDYVAANNIINYIRNNNINTVTERLGNTLTGQNVSIFNTSSSRNNSADSNRDPQTSSFHNQLKNSSEKLDVATVSESLSVVHDLDKDVGYREDEQTNPASTEENQKIANIAIARNKTSISNNQIYNNIMKRIQAAMKNRTIMNRHNRAKQPELTDSNSIRNLFSSKSDDFNSYINREMQNGTRHMINECLLSTKFLQLYLFVLFFTIYFLSILSSCILQMRGKHMCESTGVILKTKIDLLCNSSEDNNTIIIDESPHLSSLDEDNHDSTKRSNVSQKSRKQDISSRSDTEMIKEDCRSDREIKTENLLLEIDCARRIFNAIKLSLILCIVLWTPIFLGTLLRVLLCIHLPQWLIDTTFLSANSFGVARNILNMYIIKIQEICKDETKVNRIHPVK